MIDHFFSKEIRILKLPILFSIISLLILLIGWSGYKTILDSNQCQMTYSSPNLITVKIDSKFTDYGYSFVKHSKSNSNILYDQPVLFIPGHQGSARQMRSLTSSMHNNGTIQYFSVDFNFSNSAYHANNIIFQAIFVNEALLKITKLYKKKKSDIPSIIIIAHSLGGVVARTAMLLNTFPQCSVSALIMLGTPSLRSSYSPDASQDTLLQHINTAWRSSYFHTSDDCLQNTVDVTTTTTTTVPTPTPPCKRSQNQSEDNCTIHTTTTTNSSTTISQSDNNNSSSQSTCNIISDQCKDTDKGSVSSPPAKSILMNSNCPPCVSSVYLISISGGELDLHVAPALTALTSTIPVVWNRSFEHPTPQKLRNVLRPRGGWIRYAWRKIFGEQKKDNDSSSEDTSTDDDVDERDDFDTITTTEGAKVGIVQVINKNDTVSITNSAVPDGKDNGEEKVPPSHLDPAMTDPGKYQGTPPSVTSPSLASPVLTPAERRLVQLREITDERWRRDTTPHLAARVLALRTIQLAGVGYPVDHLALVWCADLLSVVTQAVLKLRHYHIPSPSEAGLNTNTSTSNYYDISEGIAILQYLESIFPVLPVTQSPLPTKYPIIPEDIIPAIQSLLLREEKHQKWKQATDLERKYFADKLHQHYPWIQALKLDSLWIMCILYFTSHLNTILICYVIISILIASIPIIRGLTNNMKIESNNNNSNNNNNKTPTNKKKKSSSSSSSSSSSQWKDLHPYYHFHFDLLTPALYLYLIENLPKSILAIFPLLSTTYATFCYLTITVVIIIKFYMDSSHLILFLQKYGVYFEWLVSYGLALFLHILFYGMIPILQTITHFIRSIFVLVYHNILLLLLMTKIHTFIPRKINVLIQKLGHWFYQIELLLVIMGVGSGILWFCSSRVTSIDLHIIGIEWTFVSLMYVTFYFTFIIKYVLLVLLPPPTLKNTSLPTSGRNVEYPLATLYLPVIVLALPSLIFSWSILFGDLEILALSIELYGLLFLLDLKRYVAVLLLVLWHVDSHSKLTYTALPVGWLTELFGPTVRSNYSATTSTTTDSTELTVTSWGNQKVCCIHEDGGTNAIYEYCQQAAATLSKGVLLGPTFRVLNCDCSKDFRLKLEQQWCDWCRCPLCGNKNSSRSKVLSRKNHFSAYPDANIDLLLGLLLLLLAALSVFFGSKYAYRQFYVLGLVAGSFQFCSFLKWIGL